MRKTLAYIIFAAGFLLFIASPFVNADKEAKAGKADKAVQAEKKPKADKAVKTEKAVVGEAAKKDDAVKPVHFLKVEGIVNPVMAEFIKGGIEKGAKAGAGAVVIELDTPGGLDLAMRDIIKSIMASEVPVVVYVSPSGARAASAGVFITYASHVAAMAPGTNLGSAHPVAMGGDKMDETMEKKVVNDATAYIKGIAAKRKRNVEWAEKAVKESVNITAEEALKLNVIDMVVASRAELLEKLHERKVETAGATVELLTKGAKEVNVEMGFRAKLLDVISNPNVAYILMMIGLVGIYFELSNPGTILPGVVGAICLILAFYSFQTLPVNYAGLALIVLAVVFFIAEIKVTSYGLLSVAGVVSLFLGSMMLFTSELEFLRVSLWVVIPTVAAVSGVLITLMYYAVKIYKTRPVSGNEGMVGQIGEAIADIEADSSSENVFVAGEYWRAVSSGPIPKGAKVRVVSINGLELKVEKV